MGSMSTQSVNAGRLDTRGRVDGSCQWFVNMGSLYRDATLPRRAMNVATGCRITYKFYVMQKACTKFHVTQRRFTENARAN